MQNAVHLRRHVGERLHLAAGEGAVLQNAVRLGIVPRLIAHVGVALADEAGRAAGAVVKLLADFRVEQANHHANQGTRRVVLSAVASGIAHLAEPRLVGDAHLVAVGLRLELERLHEVDDLAQQIAVREAAVQLLEDRADAVLDRIRPLGVFFQFAQTGKERMLHELDEFVALERNVEIERAVRLHRIRPRRPPQLLRQRRLVGNARHSRFETAFLFAGVEITQKQQPARLLHIIERPRTAAARLPELFVDGTECRRRRCVLSVWFLACFARHAERFLCRQIYWQRTFWRQKEACLVRDISQEAPLRARREISRTGTQNRHTESEAQCSQSVQACAATFFAPRLKISGFLEKQKMRLRTFDGGSNIRLVARLAADIKDRLSADACPLDREIIPKRPCAVKAGDTGVCNGLLFCAARSSPCKRVTHYTPYSEFA